MLAGSTEIQASVHSRKKVYSCLYIHLFHNRPRVQHYTAALRTATHLPAPATLPSYMIQMSGNLRISAPVFSKVVSASELYTDPKMEIWRGFQDSTRSIDCGRIRKRSPDFQMGFRHIRRQPNHHTKRQVRISPFLPFLILHPIFYFCFYKFIFFRSKNRSYPCLKHFCHIHQ